MYLSGDADNEYFVCETVYLVSCFIFRGIASKSCPVLKYKRNKKIMVRKVFNFSYFGVSLKPAEASHCLRVMLSNSQAII